jgi:threonine dehydratase
VVDFSEIESARRRIHDLLAPTPLFEVPDLDERLGAPVELKAELMQQTGSFKVRGALNWVRAAAEQEQSAGAGLITVSAGNHARGLAWAARQVGLPLTVLMPEGSSPLKVEATRREGAEVILHGTIHQTLERMEQLRRERGLTLVHPYDDPHIIAGQGTVGLEILEQAPRLGRVICPVGGGGLLSGVAAAIKTRAPEVQVVGVEPEGAPTMRRAWDRGGPETLGEVRTAAKSLGAAVAGEHTYALTREHADAMVTVSEPELRAGLELALTGAKLYAEPGAAIGLAALAAGKLPPEHEGGTTVVVLTGGNLDPGFLKELLP